MQVCKGAIKKNYDEMDIPKYVADVAAVGITDAAAVTAAKGIVPVGIKARGIVEGREDSAAAPAELRAGRAEGSEGRAPKDTTEWMLATVRNMQNMDVTGFSLLFHLVVAKEIMFQPIVMLQENCAVLDNSTDS